MLLERQMLLPGDFIESMRRILLDELSQFLDSYSSAPKRGLRVNTLKCNVEEFIEISPWRLKPTGLIHEGFCLEGNTEHIGFHPYHIAGLFYMQEPSAMCVIEAADVKPGQHVLDLCAAPGGKASGIAARMQNTGVLVANEVVLPRAKALAENITRLGIGNAIVTNSRPERIAAALPCYFDRVIVDAPCSGEGMFRKDPNAITQWSREHVLSCAIRQSAILNSASKCVAIGGKLVYSTCTFSKEENENVIERFLNENSDFELELMQRLYPHTCCGEGHFVARLKRKAERSFADNEAVRSNSASFKPVISKPNKVALDALLSGILKSKPDEGVHALADGRIILAPFNVAKSIESLHIIQMGIELAQYTSNRMKPSHAMFMYIKPEEVVQRIDLDIHDERLKGFLSGNTIPVDSNYAGYCMLCFGGYSFGFGKAVDGVLKNHIPKNLCIRQFR